MYKVHTGMQYTVQYSDHFLPPASTPFPPSPSTLIGGAFRIQLRVWGALWTPIQRVQTETGRQTVSGAFRVENQESCHGTIDTSLPKFRGRTVVRQFCVLPPRNRYTAVDGWFVLVRI